MYQHIKVPAEGQKITVNTDMPLNVPNNPIIPYIEGDGTGFDITPVMLKVVDAAVAKAYGAVCTPDFFGFDAGLGLQYRGRLDASGKNPGPEDARRELFEAMRQVAETGHGPAEQTPSIGCSIKWRAPC